MDVAAPSATVLFVSDDDYFRSTMRAYLDAEGFLVRSCGDTARVPALFFSDSGRGASAGAVQSACIDQLLIDVHSLGATGIRLAAELTRFAPDLPVIVISTPEAAKSQWTAMARRNWNFLYKPVLLPELLELVNCVMAPHQQPPRKSKRLSLASPAAGNGPRSGSSRSAGTDSGESQTASELPLRLFKAPGRIQ